MRAADGGGARRQLESPDLLEHRRKAPCPGTRHGEQQLLRIDVARLRRRLHTLPAATPFGRIGKPAVARLPQFHRGERSGDRLFLKGRSAFVGEQERSQRLAARPALPIDSWETILEAEDRARSAAAEALNSRC